MTKFRDKRKLIEHVLRMYSIHYQPARTTWQAIRCPCHADRNPSASLLLSKGFVHCHACGFRGDGYDILSLIEGWTPDRVNLELGLQETPEREEEVWI